MAGQRRLPRKTKQSSIPDFPSNVATGVQHTPVQPHRRTTRSNAGTGGRVEQLEVIGQTLQRPSRTPRPMTTLPDDEPVNPMAPTPGPAGRKKKGNGKRKSKNLASLSEEPDALPESGPVTGLPTRTPVQGSQDGRFGFKLKPPPCPTFVGSKTLDAYQNRRQQPLTIGAPKGTRATLAHAAHTSGLMPAGRKQNLSRAPSTPFASESPLSQLTDVPEEREIESQNEDNGSELDAYDKNTQNMDPYYDDAQDDAQDELHDAPKDVRSRGSTRDTEMNGSDVFQVRASDGQGPTDDAQEFDVDNGDQFVFNFDEVDNGIDPDIDDDHHRSKSGAGRIPLAKHQDSSATRRDDQPRHAGLLPVRQSFNFQRGTVQPLQDSSPSHRVPSLGGRQGAFRSGDLGPGRNVSAPSQRLFRNSAGHQSQTQAPPSLPVSNSRNSMTHEGDVSQRPGDEQVGVTYDVLRRHRAVNRRPRSPSPNYLDDVRNNDGRQPSKKRRSVTVEQEHEVEQVEENNDGRREEDQHHIPRAKKPSQHPRVKNTLKDTNMAYYPKGWQSLLDRAKARMRLHVAIEDAFPKIDSAVDGQCSEVLHELMVLYNMKSWCLENATKMYDEHRAGMCRLLFNDTQTFRSDLKKEVAKNLRVDYDIVASANTRAEERTAQIKRRAVELLANAAYLRGDVDANGKASNFAHPGLRRPCLAFFYGNSKKALRQFVEFQPSVPYKTLTLVTAIVYALLSGLREHGDDLLAFEHANWSIIESAQHQLNSQLAILLEHDYHGPKLNGMLEGWAEAGMTGFKTKNQATAGADESAFAMMLD